MKLQNYPFFESVCKKIPSGNKFVLGTKILMECRNIKIDNLYESLVNDFNNYSKEVCGVLSLLPDRDCLLFYPSNGTSVYNKIVFSYRKQGDMVLIITFIEYNYNTTIQIVHQYDLKNKTYVVGRFTNREVGLDDKIRIHLDEMYMKMFKHDFEANCYFDMIEFVIRPMIYIELSEDKVNFIDVKSKSEYGNIMKPVHVKNLLGVDVTYVNSLWNVTTMMLGEFKVRGHFRLQRYGERYSKVKLIFIEDFVKTKYVRRSTREMTFG